MAYGGLPERHTDGILDNGKAREHGNHTYLTPEHPSLDRLDTNTGHATPG